MPNSRFPASLCGTKPPGIGVSDRRLPKGSNRVTRPNSLSTAARVPFGPLSTTESPRNSPGPSPSLPKTPTTRLFRSRQWIWTSKELITHATSSDTKAMSALQLSGASDEATGSKEWKLELPAPSEHPIAIAIVGTATDVDRMRSMAPPAESLHVRATGLLHAPNVQAALVGGVIPPPASRTPRCRLHVGGPTSPSTQARVRSCKITDAYTSAKNSTGPGGSPLSSLVAAIPASMLSGHAATLPKLARSHRVGCGFRSLTWRCRGREEFQRGHHIGIHRLRCVTHSQRTTVGVPSKDGAARVVLAE